jgi:hypothetical protein
MNSIRCFHQPRCTSPVVHSEHRQTTTFKISTFTPVTSFNNKRKRTHNKCCCANDKRKRTQNNDNQNVPSNINWCDKSYLTFGLGVPQHRYGGTARIEFKRV